MRSDNIRKQWEAAAPGWAKWEAAITQWFETATESMLEIAEIGPGQQVLDIASGAGSQTLAAAQIVGRTGHLVATDISQTMLDHVLKRARTAGLDNISTWCGPAEDLDIGAESFDAAICRLGLMLFAEPSKALDKAWQALKPGGKIAVIVFTTPERNPFMAKTMQIILRHAQKEPPPPGHPGIFALGAAGILDERLLNSGFSDLKRQILRAPLRLSSSEEALEMMQEAFGAYRAVLADCSEATRTAAWAEVATFLHTFETPAGFEAPAELLVAGGIKQA